MSDEGEKELKTKFIKLVNTDFRVFPNVVGKDLIDDEKVIIDFMLYPKEHLIKAGFDPVWFGVEVKHFGISGETGKMAHFIWQCITYFQSMFKIDNTFERPAFVLGFSDVENVNPERNDSFSQNTRSQWIGMLRVAGFPHVGMIYEVLPTKYKPLGGWKIFFSSSLYFRRTGDEYERMNYNIFKKNIGNCTN